MIIRRSWRREDSHEIDPATGVTNGARQQLLTVDGTTVGVLHLGRGGHTVAVTESFGQLAIVVAGSGVAEVGDEITAVRIGDAVRWPPAVAHRLRTDDGMSVVVVAFAEASNAWRIVRVDPSGERWVVGVFGDTERARLERDRLRAGVKDGEQYVLE